MEKMGLLEKLANPEIMKTMPLGEKMLASLYITLLGMAVTFVALMIIWGCIIVMTRALNTNKPKKKEVEVITKAAPQPIAEEPKENPEELVAVITAAIAASLNTSTHNIVVRNIVRVSDNTPAWGRAGRSEQMNQML